MHSIKLASGIFLGEGSFGCGSACYAPFNEDYAAAEQVASVRINSVSDDTTAQATNAALMDVDTASTILSRGTSEVGGDTFTCRTEIGVCGVVVLHDLNLAAGLTHEIALVDAGRIVSHGGRQVFDEGLLSNAYRCATRVNGLPAARVPIVLPHGLRAAGLQEASRSVANGRGLTCG